MTSWPFVFFLHSYPPLFNLQTSITLTFPLFCFLSAAFIVLHLHCSFTLLIIALALSWWDLSSAATHEIFRGQPAGCSRSQLANLCHLLTPCDWWRCPVARWPVSMRRGHIGHVAGLNISGPVILPPNIELPVLICMIVLFFVWFWLASELSIEQEKES